MSKAKIAITLEQSSVEQLDNLITEHVFLSRSQAIQEAVKEKLGKIEHRRLAQECAKLDSNFEKAMAEEGLNKDLSEWPEY